MKDKEKTTIERIKIASEMSIKHYKKPLICTYSGGKDSDVMLELFLRSGIPFEVNHSLTTADAPATIYHIQKVFKMLEEKGVRCVIDNHKNSDGKATTMWNLIVKKCYPPTRHARYCCSALKESSCKNRIIATGVRWGESRQRAQRSAFETITKKKKDIERFDEKMLLTDNDVSRRLFEKCEIKSKLAVNPIIDWTDEEIWDFYKTECKYYNPLYDMGFKRVGCIGCPMASKKTREKEFEIFPKYKEAYIRSFEKMILERKKRGLEVTWKNGKEVFEWWIE